jgi:hypothetical protein
MKKRNIVIRFLLFGTIVWSLVLLSHIPTMAVDVSVNVGVNIPLPPAIVFSAPPQLVVIPETYVYADPDVDADIFFYGGWWWRPWEGRWYRSRNYDSGWGHYKHAPPFYSQVPSHWRDDYRRHKWKGHKWDHKRIPHGQVQRNWNKWEHDKHWEKQNTWGVRDLRRQQNSQGQHKEVQKQHQPQQSQSRHEKSDKGDNKREDVRNDGRDNKKDSGKGSGKEHGKGNGKGNGKGK